MKFHTLTSGASHFVGFHDITPWNAATEELVCLRTDLVEDHVPGPGERAQVVVIDEASGRREHVDETLAWNWQMGARQRFLPALGRRLVAYNVASPHGFGCRIADLDRRAADRVQIELARALFDVCDVRGFGLSLDFGKLFECQPGYGYAHPAGGGAPTEEGISRVELASGESRPILGLEHFLSEHRLAPGLGRHYFTHIQISPDGARYAFIHRCFLASGGLVNNLVVADTDGRGHRIVHDDKLSHFDWSGPDAIIVWCRHNAAVKALKESRFKSLIRPLYHLSRRIRVNVVRQNLYNEAFRRIDLTTGRKSTIGRGVLTEDGHPQVNPKDPDLWVNDTYPNPDGVQTLMLYDSRANLRTDLLSLPTHPDVQETTWRCDFHPRWKPDGTRICFDSAHAGRRQVCVLEVPEDLLGRGVGTGR